MAAHVVTGPAALVTDQAGKVRYYYTGSVLPGDTAPEQLTRLVGRGLVSKVDEPERSVPGQELRAALAAQSATQPVTAGAASGPVERPAQVAAKGAWVDHAVWRGMDRGTAEAMTKPDLIDACPPPE